MVKKGKVKKLKKAYKYSTNYKAQLKQAEKVRKKHTWKYELKRYENFGYASRVEVNRYMRIKETQDHKERMQWCGDIRDCVKQNRKSACRTTNINIGKWRYYKHGCHKRYGKI